MAQWLSEQVIFPDKMPKKVQESIVEKYLEYPIDAEDHLKEAATLYLLSVGKFPDDSIAEKIASSIKGDIARGVTFFLDDLK